MSELKRSRFTDSVFYDLQQTAKYSKALGIQFFEKICSDLKPEEFGALDVLIENPDICQRDLAKLIIKDRASTGKILDSLEYKGYITRHIDMKNNRLVRKMKITKAGRELLNEINQKLMENYKVVLEHISREEILELRKGLKKLSEAFTALVKMQI